MEEDSLTQQKPHRIKKQESNAGGEEEEEGEALGEMCFNQVLCKAS